MTQRRFNATLFMIDRTTKARLGCIGLRVVDGKILDSSEYWMVRDSTDPLAKLKNDWPQWDYELVEDGGDAYYADLKRSLGLG